MTIKQKLAEYKAAREEKKANKPYWAQFVTSEGVATGSITNLIFGSSHPVSLKQHFIASSQKKIDPQVGPDAVLWDIIVDYQGGGHRNREPFKLGVTFNDMCTEMLALEKAAAGKESQPDAKFVEERRPLVAKNNILNIFQLI